MSFWWWLGFGLAVLVAVVVALDARADNRRRAVRAAALRDEWEAQYERGFAAGRRARCPYCGKGGQP